jgi:single-strand DNA-binding protein
MASYNKLLIMGNLTETPELKQTPGGNCVTNFSVAVARSRKSKDEEQKTDFINVVAWRNTAEFICKYFTKGRSIFLDGELQQRIYTTKDGEKRTVYEMLAEHAQFVDKKTDAAATATDAPDKAYANNDTHFEEMSADEDLPF